MDKKLQLLETHRMRGDEGQTYVVHGHEHLTRLEGVAEPDNPWLSTGQFEYKLANGGRISIDHTGAMRVAASGVRLEREPALQTS